MKMILSSRDTAPEARLRFQREAEAVARVQHPNVVHVYEIGQHNGRRISKKCSPPPRFGCCSSRRVSP